MCIRDSATDARDRVLARALRDGLIDQDHFNAARTEVVPSLRRPFPALAPHLSDRILAEETGIGRHPLTIRKPLQISLEQLAADVVALSLIHI